MQRDHAQPSTQYIVRTCRGIQRGWNPDERKRRRETARQRQLQLLQLVSESMNR